MSHLGRVGVCGAIAGYARGDDKGCSAELELERENFLHNRVEGVTALPPSPS